MSSLLEERYRRALRMLPTAYRQAWEDDMVATFLEQAYAADPDDPEGVELGSPSRAELASIAGLALRLRLGGVGAAPRSFAWGEAIRRVALVGLLAHTIGALVGVLFMVWITQRLPGLTIPDDLVPVGFANRWQALWGLAGLLWLLAYLSLLQGHRRAAQVLAVVAFAPVPISTVVDLASNDWSFAVSRLYWLLFDVLPVLALAAFHHAAPPVNAGPWLVALPAGVVATFGVLLLTQPGTYQEVFVDWPGLWCAGLTAAALTCLVTTITRRTQAIRHWALALALLALAAFGLRVTTLLDYLNFTVPTPQRSALVTVNVAEATAALIAAVTLAAFARRALQQLPPSPLNTTQK